MPDPKDPERPQETSSFAEGLARALKVLRTARDLSRGDLAEGAGLSYSYLANIEKGRRSPSPQVLEALAGALGMPTSELIGQAETWQLPPHQAGELSERTARIMSYALCGFANFGSVGIMIAGIGGIAPRQRPSLARLGLLSIVSGSLGAFMTGCLAGLLG